MKMRKLMVIALSAPMVVQPAVLYAAADAAQKPGGAGDTRAIKVPAKKVNSANKAVGNQQKVTNKVTNTDKHKNVDKDIKLSNTPTR